MSLNRGYLLGLESSRAIKFGQIIAVLFVASVLRLLVLDSRPFHNDEGVNYFFIQSMFRDGFYKYSHLNYHGPSYFYLSALFESIIGTNEYGHRMSAVVSSMGIVLCPLFLGNLISFRSKFYSMLLLALSSSGLYYGRYAIHECLLVFVSLSFSIYLFRWLETRERKELLWIGFYLGLLISTKETFIIYFFATGAAALLVYGPVKIFSQLVRHYSYFLQGLLLCLFVVSILFSGFFRHPDGLRELLFGIQQWVGRGHSDTGHHKPFLYYSDVIWDTEPAVFLGGIVTLYFVMYLSYSFCILGTTGNKLSEIFLGMRADILRPLARAEVRFAMLILLTAVFDCLVYSYVPYKTPWLIINLTAPSLFGLGVVCGSLSERYKAIYSSLIMSALVFISGYFALKFNFRESTLGYFSKYVEPVGLYGSKNPFAYVHAYDEMVELGRDIDVYMEAHPNSKILIGSKSYWPLPFYLRKHDGKLGYVSSVTKTDEYKTQYQILILDPNIKLNDLAWDFKYYNMSDNQSANVYFKKQVKG